MKSLILIISILSFVFYKAKTSGQHIKSQTILQYTAPDYIPLQRQFIDGASNIAEPIVSVTSSSVIRNGSLLEIIYRQPGSDSLFTIDGRQKLSNMGKTVKLSTSKGIKDSLLLALKN